MKKLLLLASLLLSFVLFGQSNFKEGYYIDNQGNKVQGFIKSVNLRSVNDISFRHLEFKKSLDEDATKIEKFNITEFGLTDDVKFQKLKAKIDDVNLNTDFGYYKEFTVTEVYIFLNVLVEGSANLYSYEGGHGTKYFYKVDGKDDIAKQLLYKKYFKSPNMIDENNVFRQQLFYNVKCENQTYNDFLNVKYLESELVSIFINYNECQNAPYTVYKDEERKVPKINFSVLLGYNIGSFSVINLQHEASPQNFGMISIGGEAELLLASRTVSAFASVEYKNAKASTEASGKVSEITPTPLRQVFKFDTYFLDVLFGGRLYKNFNSSNTAFIGAAAGMNISSGIFETFQSSYISTDLTRIREEKMGASPFITFQIGYKFNNHYGIDINYDTPKKVLGNKTGQGIGKVSEFGVNLRYSF